MNRLAQHPGAMLDDGKYTQSRGRGMGVQMSGRISTFGGEESLVNSGTIVSTQPSFLY